MTLSSSPSIPLSTQELRYGLIAKMKQCRSRNDLQKGKLLHLQAVETSCDRNIYVSTALISMYGKCSSMLDARKVFESMTEHDVVSWTALILGYTENGENRLALETFNRMDSHPNHVTFVAALRACVRLATEDPSNRQTSLLSGVGVHRRASELGFDRNVFVASTLVDMYCKCGSMERARAVFDGMSHKNVVSWTVLILGYVDNGECLVALEVFDRMECSPNHVTFVAALKACAKLASENKLDRKDCLARGSALHRQVRQLGFVTELAVVNTLMDMYTKCGSMNDAQALFNGLVNRDVISWNILVLGYTENGYCFKALEVFHSMDCAADHLTYVAAIKACEGLVSKHKVDRKACLGKVMSVHTLAKERGWDRHVFVASTLVDAYSKLGNMHLARDAFDRVKVNERNVIAWTALILGYVENGESFTALEVFRRISCVPNYVTFVAALKACTDLASCKKLDRESCLWEGMRIHRQARKQGLDKETSVGNSLIDMYSKCEDMTRAKKTFDGLTARDVVSWNVLIFGYVDNKQFQTALDVFNSMDIPPECVTFIAALKACAALALKDKAFSLRNGSRIYSQVRETGSEKDVFVSSTLIDMYSKCGDMNQAREVFDSASERNVVSWNVLLMGYVENGMSSQALDMFNTMDCSPDKLTFVAALRACAGLGALDAGRRIHVQVCKLGLDEEEMVANSLVDFYGKCGHLAVAEELFNAIHTPNLVSWTALIGGYSSLGHISQVFMLLNRIQEAGLEVDSVTVLSVLTACSHAGMVEQGWRCFSSISKFGVKPTTEHFTCMVDMLTRANRLQEALSLIRKMPFQVKSPVWMTLLGACQKWSNLEIGKVAFHELLVLDDEEHLGAAYVLMGNICERLGVEGDEKLLTFHGGVK